MILSNEVECDEAYVVAGHKGQPEVVKQKTIEPLIKDTIDPGTLVYTDEYSIYARLQSWGYSHKHVNHGRGEFARDDDGDGLCEVHVGYPLKAGHRYTTMVSGL